MPCAWGGQPLWWLVRMTIETMHGDRRRDWCNPVAPFVVTIAAALAIVPGLAFAADGEDTGSRDSGARYTISQDRDATLVRGVVKAVHTAALSTEIVTPIANLGFREGERFPAGSILVELDCRRQAHELESLAATVREAKVATQSNDYLSKRGAANINDVTTAQARLDKATAEYEALAVRIANCKLMAPFDGVVTELAINRFEVPTPNKAFMTITSDRQLEIEIVAPSRLIAQLQAGRRLSFSVDETGREIAIVINRTGGAVDPVSQTMKFYAAFAGDAKDVLPGMSGAAHLDAAGEN